MKSVKKDQKQATPASQVAAKAAKTTLPPANQIITPPVGQTTAVSEAPGRSAFPIVGIGASAGGLAAFEAFFSGMPSESDPNMAFVLVQHLAPDHKSILAELLRRCTRLQVFEVEDGMVVQPNCAYIIPPNHDMAFLHGVLQLLAPASPHGQRLPIDFFFRSLAQDQHENAIGIVLSGTGSDGALGVRAIKGEGGMIMVQTPDSAEYDGMPRSAIATGMVDYELPIAEMAAKLIAFAAHAFGRHSMLGAVLPHKTENELNKIFILIRAQTSHDFSHYKLSTVQRRIERRMAVHQIETLSGYVAYLQQMPSEVDALFQNILIGVTSFFREPEAMQSLEQQIIPQLFAGKTKDAVIRIWCAGCSTGEEAYTLAILLDEHQTSIKQSFQVQVFATDIDQRSIATARVGRYPASIATDISPERLARYFIAETGSYCIHKGIRDMLIFSEHDIIKDPPFSKVDLISCRNLLIYLDVSLQEKLIPMFHYALNPEGFLFLGSSETVKNYSDLFSPIDLKAKLYRRIEGANSGLPKHIHRFLPPTTAVDSSTRSQVAVKPEISTKTPFRELTEQLLLQHFATAALLITPNGDIVYMHGRTGRYLEPSPGDAEPNNVLKMAREGLQSPLSVALHKAVLTQKTTHYPGLSVKTNGDFTTVNLTIHPVPANPVALHPLSLYFIVLEEAPTLNPEQAFRAIAADAQAPEAELESADIRIIVLKQALRDKEVYLQAANEKLENSNEELKFSNENMQSVNEELKSVNEELETNKEELQSVNEELATVNSELQTKVLDLSRANNDMNNLLAGSNIATIFVDFQKRILRFTPSAAQISNLILSDVGRPVGHIVSNLVNYTGLMDDVQLVLKSLIPIVKEVQTKDGNWYELRIQPYRTLDNVIEGAVIIFIDITQMVRTREELSTANELLRLAVVVRDSSDAITVQDLDGRMLAWNPAAARLYGWSEAEALQLNAQDRIPTALRKDALVTLVQLSRAEIIKPYITERLCKTGDVLSVSIISTALVDEEGKMYAIATTERACPPSPETGAKK